MMMPMLTSCAVLVFWRASIFGCMLMFMRWRAEAHLFGRLLLAVSRTARALCGFFVTFGGLAFVSFLIRVHLYPSLSIDYAFGTYQFTIFLCLQVLISRPFYLHSINDFHRDHWYDILPDFRLFHMIRRCGCPMHYLRGHQTFLYLQVGGKAKWASFLGQRRLPWNHRLLRPFIDV